MSKKLTQVTIYPLSRMTRTWSQQYLLNLIYLFHLTSHNINPEAIVINVLAFSATSNPRYGLLLWSFHLSLLPTLLFDSLLMAGIFGLSPKKSAKATCLWLKPRLLTSFTLLLLYNISSLYLTIFGLAMPASLLLMRSYRRMVYLLKLWLTQAAPIAIFLILSRSGA